MNFTFMAVFKIIQRIHERNYFPETDYTESVIYFTVATL